MAEPVASTHVTNCAVGGHVAIHVMPLDAHGNPATGAQPIQYTQGDVDSSVSGTAALAEAPGEALLPLQVDAAGTLITRVSPCADPPSITRISASVSSVQLLAANPARRSCVVVNDSAATMWVKFGASASSTSFTYKLIANQYLEFPQPIHPGRVDAIWDAAIGAAQITEMS